MSVNCAAIPITLGESLLFGAERGSHSGARERQIGYFEEAAGGTICLDEVGELDLQIQAKLLLCANEGGGFLRVGGTELVPRRARIVTATHRDLRKEVAAGRFREDLYHRIAVIKIRILPLSQRPDEILAAAQRFLGELSPEKRLNPSALDVLAAHPWRGGFRELKSVMIRISQSDAGPGIGAAEILAWGELEVDEEPEAAVEPSGEGAIAARVDDRAKLPPEIRRKNWLEATPCDRAAWLVACEEMRRGGSKRRVADRLRMSRQMLDRMLVAMGHPQRAKEGKR